MKTLIRRFFDSSHARCTEALLELLIFTALVCMPSIASAFKVETHVWIAQQVINDLAKGKTINIRVGMKDIPLEVRKEIRDAILNNQELFRLGSIGPDAFPGVYEGQMTIHPGAKGKAWGTGDWLAHVLRSAQTPGEVAFAYGFLTHAAADVFAHTYVNQYAGDIYLLTDGELDVEKRHFLLEGYIAQKMPPLVDADNNPMGAISDLIRKDGNIVVPKEFLRRVFIDSDDASKQFSLNGSAHMTAIHDLNRELRSMTRKDGPLAQLHVLSQQIYIYFYTGYQANAEDVNRLNEAHQRLRDITNDGIDRLQDADQQFRGQAIKVLDAANQQESDALSRAQDLLIKLQQLNAGMGDIERDLAKAIDDLNKLVDPSALVDVPECRSVAAFACHEVGHPLGCGGFFFPCAFKTQEPPGCGLISQVCETVKKWVTIVNALRPSLTQIVKEKQSLKDQSLAQLSNALSDYKAAIDQVHATAQSILIAEGKILNASIDLAQRFTKDTDPISSLLLGWLDDNNKAMDEYFLANATAMSNSMTGADMLEPLSKWVNCSAPSLMGVPSQIADGSCTVKSTIADIRQAFHTLEELAAKQDPVLKKVLELKDNIERAIKIAEKEALTTIASKVTGINMKNLMEILKVRPEKDVVDAEFSRTESTKPLVLFERVTDRVDVEMALNSNGNFNPNEFNTVHNATVLAKLALLDADALNVIMGKKVFTRVPLEHSNIMLRFASSIDGNHQWLQMPPPYPSKAGAGRCGSQYGYSPSFALWTDPHTRKYVFNGLFKGPLSPGLETPLELGLKPAFPSSYPYRPTIKNPYPNYIKPCN
jgi:hypothetical protein